MSQRLEVQSIELIHKHREQWYKTFDFVFVELPIANLPILTIKLTASYFLMYTFENYICWNINLLVFQLSSELTYAVITQKIICSFPVIVKEKVQSVIQ